MKVKRIILIILFVLFLTGCGKDNKQKDNEDVVVYKIEAISSSYSGYVKEFKLVDISNKALIYYGDDYEEVDVVFDLTNIDINTPGEYEATGETQLKEGYKFKEGVSNKVTINDISLNENGKYISFRLHVIEYIKELEFNYTLIYNGIEIGGNFILKIEEFDIKKVSDEATVILCDKEDIKYINPFSKRLCV